MSTTFDFFLEVGLVNPAGTVSVLHQVGIGGDPHEQQLFLGSNTPDRKIRDAVAPGTNNLIARPVNATPQRANSTAYNLNDEVRTETANGYKYRATTIRGTGTTAATPPAWPTIIGATVDDDSSLGVDGVTWTNIGKIHEASEMRLATSQAGLATATGGAALNLGIVELLSNSAPQAVWVRLTDATDVVGLQTELSVRLDEVQEDVA